MGLVSGLDLGGEEPIPGRSPALVENHLGVGRKCQEIFLPTLSFAKSRPQHW